MMYMKYETLQNGDLSLAKNVEAHGDLTKKEWEMLKHESEKLRYEYLHERFGIYHSNDLTALLFRCSDGTLRLVESVEKCLGLSDPHIGGMCK